MSKKQTTKKSRQPSFQRPRRWALWLVLFTLIAFVIGIIFTAMPGWKNTPSGPRFQKEGELQFLSAEGRSLQTIDIEIADNEMDQARGLMWRKSMEENQGMLFIMARQEEQSFWMLNTYIPLDIIFVNDQFEIVKIRTNTKPQSLDQITSERPALYVVEVNAGFCEKFGIKEGDTIRFEKK